MCASAQNKTIKWISIICLGIIIFIRSNKKIEEVVSLGIGLSLKNEFIQATYMMKKAGVPHHVIVRVLYDQDKVRDTDMIVIKQFG